MSEWTRPAQPIRCAVELDKPLTVRRERWLLAQGDANANAIVAEVYQTAGKPYDLTGCTVMLTFVRPDNLALPPIEAEISGNTAIATLKDACYEESGVYVATMQLRKDGAERTILWLIGDVKGKDIDGIVDPDHEIISIEDLMATAAEAQKATSAANAAADRANAGAERAEQLAIDASGLAGDSNKLGDKPPEYYLPVVNLLGNPDFAIAHAGYGGKHGETVYAADRWVSPYDEGDVRFEKASEGIIVTTNWQDQYFYQALHASELTDDTYTFAIKCEGDVSCFLRLFGVRGDSVSLIKESWTQGSAETGWYYRLMPISAGEISGYDKIWFAVVNRTAVVIHYKEPVLYPGTYTADTFPPFVPRPYTVELAECQRHYRREKIKCWFQWYWTNSLRVIVNYPKMCIDSPTANLISARFINTDLDKWEQWVWIDLMPYFTHLENDISGSNVFVFQDESHPFVEKHSYQGEIEYEIIADL